MAYTLGFNPTMKVSMGIALPLFAESESELVDIEILDHLSEQEVMDIISPKLPDGAKVIGVKEVERYTTAVDICAQWAEYKITPYIRSGEVEDFESFKNDVEKVLSMPKILITKKTKKKQDKVVDFKNSIGSYRFENNALFIHLKVGQGSDVPAFRADDLMKVVDSNKLYEITRIKFLNEKLHEM
jgi:radical SAM-linked protein